MRKHFLELLPHFGTKFEFLKSWSNFNYDVMCTRRRVKVAFLYSNYTFSQWSGNEWIDLHCEKIAFRILLAWDTVTFNVVLIVMDRGALCSVNVYGCISYFCQRQCSGATKIWIGLYFGASKMQKWVTSNKRLIILTYTFKIQLEVTLRTNFHEIQFLICGIIATFE